MLSKIKILLHPRRLLEPGLFFKRFGLGQLLGPIPQFGPLEYSVRIFLLSKSVDFSVCYCNIFPFLAHCELVIVGNGLKR